VEARQRVKLSLTNRSSGLISSAFAARQSAIFRERRAQQQACAQDTSKSRHKTFFSDPDAGALRLHFLRLPGPGMASHSKICSAIETIQR
jgi:hypothetical protein